MHTNRILGWVTAASVLLVTAMNCRAGVLDGTKWKVKVVPDKTAADKGEKEFADELIFADGKFTSTALLPQGFKPSKYNGEVEPGEAEFEVEQVSETAGVVTWLGEIRGTNAVGRLRWMQKDRGNFAFEFSGNKE
jgi:hypothetical protein